MTPYLSIGHRVGAAASEEILDLLGADLFASNTWITADAYDRALRASETLAADAWGAGRSFYLVDGSSSGNHAILLACLRPGDKVVISRDIHWSMLVALILTGAEPIYVAPRLDEVHDIGLGLDPSDVAQALDRHPDAKLVAIVSPSFCGVATDVAAIAGVAHARGIPLFVDEAWGAHFHFHPLLPPSAMASGADAAVASVHKLLPAISQGSVLHVQGERINYDRLATAVRMMQTTSPLLPTVASLDAARRQMALDGERLLDRVITLARETRRRLDDIPGFEVVGSTRLGLPPERADITKLVIDLHRIGLTGYEVEQQLNDRFNIAVELSDHRGIIANFNLGDTPESADRFTTALKVIAAGAPANPGRPPAFRSSGAAIAVTEQGMTPRDAYFAPSRRVPLEDAVDEIAAELVTPYPPGIPVLAPGDVISREKVAYLVETYAWGRGLYGDRDAGFDRSINIVDRGA
ncbi:MAG: aminotransferase class V-fold PLP-dependent enzyme [Thermomicrobiales bacterium]|nr:aminotransferase class V-fold PLP-dependent enzyme [Thermomicrobiales bacterium]